MRLNLSDFPHKAQFPLLIACASYPLCAMVPALRKKGRRAERTLGLIFSVAGYIGGMLFCFLTDSTPIEKLIYATYFCSGIGLAVCTLLHFKASGHTCGCSGPIMVLSVLISPWFLLGYVLLGAIMWASRSLERHSVAQLVGGSLVPVLMLFLCMSWVM